MKQFIFKLHYVNLRTTTEQLKFAPTEKLVCLHTSDPELILTGGIFRYPNKQKH